MSGTPGIVDGHGAPPEHPPGPELRRLVDGLRRVTDQVVRTDAPPGLLAEAAALVEQVEAALEPVTAPWRPAAYAQPSSTQNPHDYFPFSPMIGFYNPLAPPLVCEVRDGIVRATGALGAAYEGPPGCVHGGVIAALFDELLGVANIAKDVGAMTGTLTIRYRSPTPLHTELTLEGRSVDVDGRKVRAVGTLHAGDRLCAEAEGIFVMVDRARFAGRTPEHQPDAP